MLKNIGLFCKRALQKRPVFCKETCIFKHPTNRSHPICERVTSHVWLSHLTYVNESHHICRRVFFRTIHMTCVKESTNWDPETQLQHWICHMTYVNKSYVMRKNIILFRNSMRNEIISFQNIRKHKYNMESWRTCEWVMSTMYMSHGTYVNELWHMCEWISGNTTTTLNHLRNICGWSQAHNEKEHHFVSRNNEKWEMRNEKWEMRSFRFRIPRNQTTQNVSIHHKFHYLQITN